MGGLFCAGGQGRAKTSLKAGEVSGIGHAAAMQKSRPDTGGSFVFRRGLKGGS